MSLQIFLDNYSNRCFAGQTLSGRIECTFNTTKKIRAIRVKFRGRAKTSWSEQESYYNYSTKKTEYRTVLYHAEETYINAEYNLTQGAESLSVPPGKHVYPFSYILPTNIPSSFEGKVGNIYYYVKAVVDRPWKFDYKAKVPLNMVSLIDLNYIQGLRDPVALSVDKTVFSCCCNDTGPLTFNLTVPITGYVPGQEINIGSYVRNLTNVSAERVQYKVGVSYTYIATYPSRNAKRYSDDVVRCVEGGIGAHGEKSWTSTLLLPTNRIYPNLSSCSIINVDYVLKAKVILPSPHSNLQLDFPITIGSVALSGANLPNTSGSAPNPQHAGASAPYLPAVDGLPPYSSPMEASSSYLQKTGLIEPNSKDTTASAPNPQHANASAPYLPAVHGLPSYSSSMEPSSSYPQKTGWIEPNSNDTTASAPNPQHANASVPYLPAVHGLPAYPTPGDASSSYPQKAGWIEPNSKDTTATAPPPSYEESQPHE